MSSSPMGAYKADADAGCEKKERLIAASFRARMIKTCSAIAKSAANTA
jgi:hypothetical protein